MTKKKEEKDPAEEIVAGIEKEMKEQRELAEKAREDAGHDEGETEEEYRDRIANVPGIFGDTDTTAGGSMIDVPSRNNEEATVAVAAAEASDEDVSVDEARRQVDISAEGQPSAEEVDEAAPERDEDDKDEKKTPARRNRK